jgi:hypothetical protein
MTIHASITTESGAVIEAEWAEGEAVIISQGGHEAGRGQWTGRTIVDCSARLGAADGSETESAYEALDEALTAEIEAVVSAAAVR